MIVKDCSLQNSMVIMENTIRQCLYFLVSKDVTIYHSRLIAGQIIVTNSDKFSYFYLYRYLLNRHSCFN